MAKAQLLVLPAARNTVIVVDDQSTGRAILEQVVRSLDDRVMVEGFGRPVDAVVWATRHIADLVLIDYMMPEMNGIELAKRLRALPGYEHVPIVMITGQDDKKVRYAALDAGITDFLTKPVDARECLARCRNLLTLRRQHLAVEDKRRLLEGMVDEATREIREREKETLLRLARAGEFRDEETQFKRSRRRYRHIPERKKGENSHRNGASFGSGELSHNHLSIFLIRKCHPGHRSIREGDISPL